MANGQIVYILGSSHKYSNVPSQDEISYRKYVHKGMWIYFNKVLEKSEKEPDLVCWSYSVFEARHDETIMD